MKKTTMLLAVAALVLLPLSAQKIQYSPEQCTALEAAWNESFDAGDTEAGIFFLTAWMNGGCDPNSDGGGPDGPIM